MDEAVLLANKVEEAIKQAISLKSLDAALETLYPLEKQTRLAADVELNKKILVTMVDLAWNDKVKLEECLTNICKKRSILKQAIQGMVQYAMEKQDQAGIDGENTWQLVRTLSEGKIFLEQERARCTQKLAALWEKSGRLSEAANIMLELPVETFGSMERYGRIGFILEQMRLAIAIGDWQQAGIMAGKVSPRVWEPSKDEASAHASLLPLKRSYFGMMVQLSTHDGKWAEACQHHLTIRSTLLVDQPAQALDHLHQACALSILATWDAALNKQLASLLDPVDQQWISLLKTLSTHELVVWDSFAKKFSALLPSDLSIVQDRIVEHNIAVIASCYERIRLERMSQLLNISPSLLEEKICSLVQSGSLWARIDRPTMVITFKAPRNPHSILNDWMNQVSGVLNGMVRVHHLIAKEEMVHSIKQ